MFMDFDNESEYGEKVDERTMEIIDRLSDRFAEAVNDFLDRVGSENISDEWLEQVDIIVTTSNPFLLLMMGRVSNE